MSAPLIIVDAHEDVMLRVLDRGDDLGEPYENTHGQGSIEAWRSGGVNVVWFSIWINPRKYSGEEAVTRADRMINAVRKQVSAHPQDLALCDTASDCRRAVASGKVSALLGIEGGIAINNDISLIEKYRKQHVRYMTLTWRGNLDWAGSSQAVNSGDRITKKGLNEFGRKVVSELNRMGIIVDLSHVSDETFYDALAATTKPVIVSHSNCRSLANHPRNVTDDMLRALAKNGGVIGVNFAAEFLDARGLAAPKKGLKASVDTLVEHIDHIVKVAGIDHVGFGSDWDGGITPARGVETAGKMGNLIEALKERGYTDGEIRKIAGENFLRVLEANESPSNIQRVDMNEPAVKAANRR